MGASRRLECAEGVERAKVRGRIEQRLVLVLTVQFDEARREILQRTGRRERAVDERAAASLRRDLAADQQFFAAALEDGLDRRRVFAGTDQVARRAPTEQKSDGFDQDRLARPGFAREHVQARIELDLDRVDDREMFDAKEPQHAKIAKPRESERTPILT